MTRCFYASCIVWMSVTAHAQSYDLQWSAEEGTESCPRESIVAAEVAARLQRNPFSSESDQQLFIVWTRSETHWHAALSVRHASGEEAWSRPLQSSAPTCDTLADAVVLAVVLMIDPAMAAAPVADPEPVVDPEPDPDIAPEPEPQPQFEPEQPEAPGPELSAHAGVSVGGGVLPKVTPSAHLGIEGRILDGLRWGLGMRFFPEARTSDGDFAFGLTVFSVSLCANARPFERFIVGGCASPLVGVIHAVVFEPDPTFPGDRAWVGLSTDVMAMVRIVGPVWVRLDAGVLWSLLRRRFDVRDVSEPAFRQDLVGLNAALSLAIRIP